MLSSVQVKQNTQSTVAVEKNHFDKLPLFALHLITSMHSDCILFLEIKNLLNPHFWLMEKRKLWKKDKPRVFHPGSTNLVKTRFSLHFRYIVLTNNVNMLIIIFKIICTFRKCTSEDMGQWRIQKNVRKNFSYDKWQVTLHHCKCITVLVPIVIKLFFFTLGVIKHSGWIIQTQFYPKIWVS